MKANRAPYRLLVTLGLALALASCSQQRAIPPVPVPTPSPQPQPLPPEPPKPAPAPQVTDWRDAPITPGNWHWQMEGARSVARFGGANAESLLVLSCSRETGSVTLIRPGAASAPVPMTILTSSLSRTADASAVPGPPPMIALTLPARDALLDAMAFSRGRFAVQTAGLPTLYVPSWTEVSRVIEDCR